MPIGGAQGNNHSWVHSLHPSGEHLEDSRGSDCLLPHVSRLE